MSQPSEWPPRLSLKQPKILELLTGERFYSSADAALREALLNSIDACNRRMVADSRYRPQIKIVFDSQAQAVSISDNGDGMTKSSVVTLFARIGSSASDQDQGPQPGGLSAIGEFGIGIASYFLACEQFEVHTKSDSEAAIGLRMSRGMRDAMTPASEIESLQQTTGTTIVLQCTDEAVYGTLRRSYSHWAREVIGLEAIELPDNVHIAQGGLRAVTEVLKVEVPEWLERVHVGPPASSAVWGGLDGSAHVDILYRGVFVQELSVPHLWGIQGALHVDPKRFKPKLNREAFLAEGFQEEVTRFLRGVHPIALWAALDAMRMAFGKSEPDNWSLRRWVSLWLAIPRQPRYADAAAAWDAEFRSRRLFRRVVPDRQEPEDLSLDEIRAVAPTTLYVAPPNLRQVGAVVRSAVALLAAKGAVVIQGYARDKGYLAHAWALSDTTTALIDHFRAELPQIVKVESVATDLLRRETIVGYVFSDREDVCVYRLGDGSEPLVMVSGEVWINIDSGVGRSILNATCDRNEGALGLVAAVGTHLPSRVAEVASVLRKRGFGGNKLSPVRRMYFRVVQE